MQVPEGYDIRRTGVRLWIRPEKLAGMLDPLMSLPLAHLRQLPAASPVLAGRQGPIHIPAPDGSGRLFIRPYAHGGWLARYLPQGFRSLDRGIKELFVSTQARESGLPTPDPIGLSAEQLASGRWAMQAWSRWISGTISLAAFIKNQPGAVEDRRPLLESVARGLKRCHDAGLSHRDLNANNVIVKQQEDGFQVTIVDLDRAEFVRPLPERTRRAQLRRLYRSLAKEKVIPSSFSDDEYSALVEIYFQGRMKPDDLTAFMRSCRLGVFWHSLLWR